MPRARKPRQRRSPRDSHGTAVALRLLARQPDPRDLACALDTLDTRALYAWMKAHGTALAVRWDESAETFECAWVVGGERHVGRSRHPRVAIVAAASQALD